MPENHKSEAVAHKRRLHLLPPGVRDAVVRVLEHGADKYGPFNYRKGGVKATIYYDATNRHLDAWLKGEDVDPDSGELHVAHAIASLVVLLDGYQCGVVDDDRPSPTRPGYTPAPPDMQDFPAFDDDTLAGMADRATQAYRGEEE